jgi:nucleotide-binding universal stress UspA family protein
LFATDLSWRAQSAGDVAARIARAWKVPLVVAHASADEARRALLDDEVARVSKLTPASGAWLRTGALAALEPSSASVVDGVERWVGEHGPRLVVVGAQGEGERALLGTTASLLVARLPCPVLVVRNARHIVRFFDEQRELSVLVTESFDDTFPPARDALVEIAKLGPVDAIVGHWSFGVDDEANIARRHELHAVLAREMKEALRDIRGVDVDLLVRHGVGRLDVLVCDLARERDVDLVVCGTHQRRALERVLEGSIASGIVRDSPCSVLVAPRLK